MKHTNQNRDGHNRDTEYGKLICVNVLLVVMIVPTALFKPRVCAAESNRPSGKSVHHRGEDAVLHPGKAYRGEKA